MTKDLVLIFLERTLVHFKSTSSSNELVSGCWCNLCKLVDLLVSHRLLVLIAGRRVDKSVRANKGGPAGFYKGANSTYRHHIASMHYSEYSKQCAAASITEHPMAVPKAIKDAREAKAVGKDKGTAQSMLDRTLVKVHSLTAFSCEALLDTVVRHIVVGDQVRVSSLPPPWPPT